MRHPTEQRKNVARIAVARLRCNVVKIRHAAALGRAIIGEEAENMKTQAPKYQERPGKLKSYMSGYASWRASWLAQQRKPVAGMSSCTRDRGNYALYIVLGLSQPSAEG